MLSSKNAHGITLAAALIHTLKPMLDDQRPISGAK